MNYAKIPLWIQKIAILVIRPIPSSTIAPARDITTEDNYYSKLSNKSKNKILLLGPLPPTIGGITAFLKGILESDLSRKYKLITFGTERPTFGVVRDVNDYTLMFHIGPICLIKSAVSTISHLLKFPLVLIRNRPDIVHIHTSTYWSFWENVLYLLTAKMLSRKTLFHVHGGSFNTFYQSSNCLVKFIIRKVLNLPNKVIVLSSTWKRFFANFVPEDKVVILENFVNSSQFGGIKKRVNPSKNTVRVLFVGGVGAKAKGLYDILKAIPLIKSQYKHIQFVFVACSNIKELDAIYDREEIASCARFVDYLQGDNKIEIFKESDIFILPSYSEGFPITMLEAMAAGLPVIATPVGAVPEIIEDGKNGFLVNLGDYRALAERTVVLAKGEKLRREMGKHNLEKIMKQYDQSIIIRKLDGEYSRLIGNGATD